jgi:hypothetical protein
MRYVRASERALTMWPIEVVAASGRPDPVDHVKLGFGDWSLNVAAFR